MKIPQKPNDLNEIFKNNIIKLMKLFEEKEVKEFIGEANNKYIHWDKLRRLKMPGNEKPDMIWALIKLSRMVTYRNIKFNKYVFNYSSLSEFQKRLHLLDKGMGGKILSNNGSVIISSQERERYILSSLMEEAIASSQLEGAVTTRKLAKEILRSNKKPKTYSEQMIMNGYITMQEIIKIKEKKLTKGLILKLHKSITKDTLKDKKYEDTFRDNNEVVVGDSIELDKIYHQPPNYKEIPKLIDELCEFVNNDEKEFIHPIIKGIILHFLIGYIHPFEDGNGRTARTLFYWYALTRGYWLFEFMAISRIILRSKVKYGMAYLYTETDDNDITYFIDYNLKCIEKAMRDMNSYIDRKQKEQTELLNIVKKIKNINLRQAELLKEAVKESEKPITISEVINTFGVAYDTARNDLLQLSKSGYLEKTKIQKKYLFRINKDKIITELK
ncbi:transposase [archaeon CG06_land_8_20_14_3_00_37_11]|nr:MAG: transposase [archaeon CG06_land_8_20_14_3_00_37_11]